MPSFVIVNSPISALWYRLRQRYLKRKYANLPPKLYYDRWYRTYISPAKLEEDGEVEWVCGELADTNLIYEYCLDGKETHAHTFADVLRAAYDDSEGFSIPEEYEGQYSAQELEFLQKLAEQGVRDRSGKGTVR